MYLPVNRMFFLRQRKQALTSACQPDSLGFLRYLVQYRTLQRGTSQPHRLQRIPFKTDILIPSYPKTSRILLSGLFGRESSKVVYVHLYLRVPLFSSIPRCGKSAPNLYIYTTKTLKHDEHFKKDLLKRRK